MTTTFARLGLPKPLVHTLGEMGFTEPFPVQSATIPDALAGWDVSAKAPTGSGKTLAFGLPLLANVGRGKQHRPQALILAPTRELAEQIKQDLLPLAKSMGRQIAAIYGGVSYGGQRAALRNGVDVLVATPGRLEDLIEQRVVDLSEVAFRVIDEADRMADMGFLPAVRRILDATNGRSQTMLFSATLDGDIAVLSRDYQHEPVRHEAQSLANERSNVSHHFWLVDHGDRVRHSADVVGLTGRSIVFTRTRRGADRLVRQFGEAGVEAVALHGGRSQRQRARALQQFVSGKARALIATDVAARGIHIDDVESVVHFDPPADAKDYVHRSGRTARAGAGGTVVSLVTKDQKRAVVRMQRHLDLEAPIEPPHLGSIQASRSGKTRAHNERRRPLPEDKSAAHDRSRRNRSSERRHKRAGQRPQASSIYVANLAWSTTDADLRSLFKRHGRVDDATIITDRRTGRSKGFGFVDMPQPAATAAVKALHGSRFKGRNLTVRVARPRRRRV